MDAQEFVRLLLLVFENSITFNSLSANESDYVKELVEKSAYLKKYASHCCLEYLPLFDDRTLTNDIANKYGPLRSTLQENVRHERYSLISETRIHDLTAPTCYSDCKKLLKDLERYRTKEEQNNIVMFMVPVDTIALVDYSSYIRHPMDLSTLKYKLDGTEPIDRQINSLLPKHTLKAYEKYGEFLTDLKRIFENAKKYNKVHYDDDTTETSRRVYHAAVTLSEKLDNLIPKFTLILADKIECSRFQKRRELQEKQELLAKLQQEEEEKRLLKQKYIEELKQTDLKSKTKLKRKQKLIFQVFF
jgi:hypothetical protein